MIVAAMVAICAVHVSADEMRQVAGRLLFHPLLASQFEPRLGVEKALDENFLTLNIGNSVDLIGWQSGGIETAAAFRIGADFFTWSHLLSGSDFRFPVQAIDFLFGVNGSWISRPDIADRWEARVRLAHISAHVVDGSYNNYAHQWTTREPFTYSREFIDAIIARELCWNDVYTRTMIGGTLLLHSIPDPFAAFAPHAGFELHASPDAFVIPYIAYDVRLQRISQWRASHALYAGVKFGHWEATGTQIFVAYESGESMHGVLYDYSGAHGFAGVNVVF